MTPDPLSRREFLKISAAAVGGLAFRPHLGDYDLYDPAVFNHPLGLGVVRVTVSEVKVYKEPSYSSDEVGRLSRDTLLAVHERLVSPYGPQFNPRWYRIPEGYIHTAYLQPVQDQPQTPNYSIPEGGQLAEIMVPATQSLRNTKFYGWENLYRLYYGSVHWVTDIDSGPDGEMWYEITDDLLKLPYWISARHARFISPEELTPLAADVPPHEKRVTVSIKHQSLTAFEGGEVVLHTEIATGIPNLLPTSNGVSTATPRGRFNVHLKVPVRHMGDGKLTADIQAYELPGVPWVSFFEDTGVAFHGTYWHDNYGNEMSHGCVNMRLDEAKWLYRWLTPVIEPQQWYRAGFGTQVDVV
ncbi:MAG: L,D-transpeptidase [Chloroflexi bacterium]|nr:L,D-transpeptidase [Chloroflexota bacterium]